MIISLACNVCGLPLSHVAHEVALIASHIIGDVRQKVREQGVGEGQHGAIPVTEKFGGIVGIVDLQGHSQAEHGTIGWQWARDWKSTRYT